jgi:hypothetical protein
LFPFLIIANALAGRSAATGLARHLGLNKQAAADVGALFTSSAATSSAVTGTAWVFFILGGIAAATAIQGLYEAAFELEGRGARDMFRRLIWLAVLVGCSALAGWAGPALRGAGGPVLLGVIGLVVLTGFWWFTMWFLLAGRISWRDLFPAAVATALFWLGMEVHQRRPVASGGEGKDPKRHGDRAADRRDPPQALAGGPPPPPAPLGVIGACPRWWRGTCHPLVAGSVAAGCAGGLPISSMRPSTTSSRTAITMVTAAIGWPQKTKISAASATAPIRSACRFA